MKSGAFCAAGDVEQNRKPNKRCIRQDTGIWNSNFSRVNKIKLLPIAKLTQALDDGFVLLQVQPSHQRLDGIIDQSVLCLCRGRRTR
jgi:hypothetical protein